MGNGTSIGKVRGLGSAHQGPHHWLLQRFTAIGNLVLMLFLLASFIFLPDLSYTTLREWFARPLPATAVALLVVSVFWHARLGLQVMLEDYVDNSGNRFALIALLNLAAVAGIGIGLFSIASMAFGGAA
ncbi:succinate dehydrogenase, hydrophobic membrane anchor protein [Qipengyuania atrilutea]|uniref:Succinate dehydrogenase hydrophobic membrane anchor subunit n=1 Tax=Qipengyuania atrilutea TaxID=2744473 RepID=A0A850H212_9SPHN|nr:succinate dehydrogenase, hydrophobic membrane anchor protein [Actirhodobacter atriluteus]NVD43958.1 succinate dehydrogenase, hydrophobic membrane anchor protein [Actirhodobacter atriluteus]